MSHHLNNQYSMFSIVIIGFCCLKNLIMDKDISINVCVKSCMRYFHCIEEQILQEGQSIFIVMNDSFFNESKLLCNSHCECIIGENNHIDSIDSSVHSQECENSVFLTSITMQTAQWKTLHTNNDSIRQRVFGSYESDTIVTIHLLECVRWH